ncbi:metallophosphoesterase [Paenibacillus puerhi]|uniref:metallophosphoesterase n=1 Tax=Paenibacillus puerhi TaxID=2692622 RepID=UPI00135AC309|nr:metallophosphoesterase [Paenibacillus puerhi]
MTTQAPEHTKKTSRRSFLMKAALALFGIASLPPAAFAYARYAEPIWLDIERVTLTTKRLPASLDGLKVVQFSDTHLGFNYDAEDLARLAETINRLNPDVICFTGDLVDYAVGSEGPAYAEALGIMQAKLGKFAVLGNHDYFKGGDTAVARTLAAGDFKVLRNQAVQLEQNGGRLWIAGVEDMWHGKPDIAKCLNAVNPDEYVLLLSHSPDYADTVVDYPVDLQLSGHTHGGQVRIPFYGHVVVPKFGQKYIIGHYKIGSRNFQLYVNRGIGVSQHPVRFNCRPELTVFTLKRG